MAKKDIREPEKDQLLVAKDEVKAKLQTQIDEGENIAKMPTNNASELKKAKDAMHSWLDFTREILLRSFSTDKMEQELAWAVRVFGSSDKVAEFHEHMDLRLNKLKSIHKRVDLYEDVVPREVTGIHSGYESQNKKRVFVVHGRNEQLLKSMFQFLDAIGLEPIEWNKAIAMTGKPSPSVPEIVSTAFREAQATIVLLSGDDLAILRKEFIRDRDEAYEKVLTPQARPNVLFEAGQAMAIDQERTILVQVGKIRKFSDIQGLHITYFDNSPQKRQELITKLRNAHCDIRDISAENRWMEVGNFDDKFALDTSHIDEVSTTTKPSAKRTVHKQLKQSESAEVPPAYTESFSIPCKYSNGKGEDPYNLLYRADCPACKGTGWITLPGGQDDYVTCGNCKGSGQDPDNLLSINPCHICRGSGLIKIR